MDGDRFAGKLRWSWRIFAVNADTTTDGRAFGYKPYT